MPTPKSPKPKAADKPKHPGGRPPTYSKQHVEDARKLAAFGATDADIAEFFGVSVSTINRWKIEHPEFKESVKVGKDVADERVKDALYHRAIGYSVEEDDIRVVEGEIVVTPTVKHYPPDATSAIFWLKNRRPEEFRDKVDVNHGIQPDNPLGSLLERLAGSTIKPVKDGE